MRLLGLPVPFTGERSKTLSPVREGGWFRIFEPFSGAWQRGVKVEHDTVLTYHAVYSCMTLIASDIAKLRLKLVQQSEDGIWTEIRRPASPIFRKPNHFQTRIQFWESWMLSKLSRGNTYALKRRDQRGRVDALYILDPTRVTPLVSEDGGVYYQLMTDNLSGLPDAITVPASEIIHDRMNCLFHPLVGTSPIFAAGVAATQGLRIQNNSANFFGNQSQPGGLLTAPGAISKETAERLKAYWDSEFTGAKAGKVAVVGDGIKFEALGVNAHDAQLIEQLKWTAEVICSVFHVPGYKIGVGPVPNVSNVQSLNVEYYSQALQIHIESIENCLDDGLDFGEKIGAEFDLDDLLRMDTGTLVDVAQKAKGILTLDEQRRRLNVAPVEGGDTIYLQQQDHSLAAIAARDQQLIQGPTSDPIPKPTPAERAMRSLLRRQMLASMTGLDHVPLAA